MAVGFCRCMLFRRFTEFRSISGRISATRAASAVADFVDSESRDEELPSMISQKGIPVTKESTSVHPDVAKILEDSRPKFVGGNWHKPRFSARRLAELRKASIALGYYWPEKPLIDRGLDRTPKGHRYEREKKARLERIERNMKNMPKIIEEYRKKMKAMRTKRHEEKKDAKERSLEARRMGIHPKDPRGVQAARSEDKSKKKKFQKKAK